MREAGPAGPIGIRAVGAPGGRPEAPDRERLILFLGGAALAVLTAVRLLTLARDAWEWDELLFTAAAREGIDVRPNHPHPPGYPAYSLLARLLHLAGLDPFLAALAVAVIAGIVAVPALAAFSCELGVPPRAALFGSLLWAFVPAVWLHSVRPLSDAPGAAAFFVAGYLFLRAWREPSRGWIVGAALAAAVSAGVRPQVGLALAPMALLVAVRTARTKGGVARALTAGAAGAAAAVLLYLPVVLGSGGLAGYLEALGKLMEFVRVVDAPSTSQLLTPGLWARWLLDPFGPRTSGLSVWALALVGVAVSPRRAAAAAGFFVPLAALSVPLLAAGTAPRYALTLVAFPCLLATLAVGDIVRRRRWAGSVLATVLLGAVAFPGVPAIVEVATRSSPSVAAVSALRDDPALRGRPLVVDGALGVHCEEMLGGVFPAADGDRPTHPGPGGLVVKVDSGAFGLAPLRLFRYEEPLLGVISRARYLEVGIYDGEATDAPLVRVGGKDSRTDSRTPGSRRPGGR